MTCESCPVMLGVLFNAKTEGGDSVTAADVAPGTLNKAQPMISHVEQLFKSSSLLMTLRGPYPQKFTKLKNFFLLLMKCQHVADVVWNRIAVRRV